MAALILVAWAAGIALLVRREYFKSSGLRLAEASLRVGPGAEFYAVSMGGGPIGYASSTVDTTPEGLTVQDLLVLDIEALGKVQRTQLSTDVRLTRDLRLKSFEGTLDVPGAPFRASGTVSGDSVLDVTIEAGGQPTTTRVRLNHPIVLSSLLPLELAFGHQLAPGKSYSVRVLDPMSMEERDVTVRVLAESTLVVPDSAAWDSAAAKWVPARQDTLRAWKVAEEFGGVATESWIDRQGRIVSAVSPIGFRMERMAFELAVENWRRAATQHLAVAGGSGDIIDATAITANVPLQPENLSVLRVRIGNTRLAGFDLSGGRQQLSGDTLTIRRETGVAASSGGPASLPLDRLPTTDTSLAADLASEPLVQANDPRIQAQARRIIGREHRAGAVAELLTHWVYANLKKEITISVPSAVQVLDERRGDCNEHTVLYVALARSLGLPARTAAGLVYLRGRFYYHAWPEVWLGRWVAVDPTFNQFPADASHLRFVIGGLARQVELLRLIGRVTVTVVGSAN
ncbi:MAG: transglutaminase-like domain-containing protein [Gemmatimonadales bacterium]